jgi:ribosomal protein L32E
MRAEKFAESWRWKKARSAWRSEMGAHSKRKLYHRQQAHRLQRDVQLTEPLAIG